MSTPLNTSPFEYSETKMQGLLRYLLVMLSVQYLAAPAHALFNNKKKKEQDDQAAKDVMTGFHGIQQASKDPAMMAELMKSMQDPEIMAEAQKMMQDPAFQRQMKEMMNDKSVKKAAEAAKETFSEISTNPQKRAELEDKVSRMMSGVDTQTDLSEGMRKDARAAAGAAYGLKTPQHGVDKSLDGAQNAALGMQALQESLNNPNAMAQAMELMKDPSMVAEVEKMMSDPDFRRNLQEMAAQPELKAMLGQGAEQMQAMMQDPEALAKMQSKLSDMMRA